MATEIQSVYKNTKFIPIETSFQNNPKIIVGWNTVDRRDDETVFPEFKSNPEEIKGFSNGQHLHACWGYGVTIDKSNPHGYATVEPDHSVGYDLKKFLPNEQAVFSADIDNGYEFKQWGDGSTDYPKTENINSCFTLSVKTQVVPYEISYEMNGGTNHPDNPYSYNVESETITLQTPTKENYNFTGWTPSGVIPTGSYGNKSITANWQIKELVCNYLRDDGTVLTADYDGTLSIHYTGTEGYGSYSYEQTQGYTTDEWRYEMDHVRVYVNDVLKKELVSKVEEDFSMNISAGDVIRTEILFKYYYKATEYTGYSRWIINGSNVYSLQDIIGTISYCYYK